MNWTGGNLQRHSKNKNNAVAERQRIYFAKARSKAINRGSSSSYRKSDTPVRSPSPPLAKRVRRNHHSPDIHKWSPAAKINAPVQSWEDFIMPSGNNDVRIKVGNRAFASQLDTTVASPSTRSRPTCVSSISMLPDETYYAREVPESLDGSEPVGPQFDHGSDWFPDTLSSKTRFVLSEPLQRASQDQEDTQDQEDIRPLTTSAALAIPSAHDGFVDSRHNYHTPLTNNVHSNPDLADRGNCPLGAVKQPHDRSDTSAYQSSHNQSPVNHERHDVWQRFVQDKAEVSRADRNMYKYAALHHTEKTSPYLSSAWRNAQEEPLYPDCLPPHSSPPTSRACLYETGISKRMSGETSEQTESLDEDEQIWRRFVLGSEDTDSL